MKTKKIPMRRCAGCMESRPKNELIRIAGYEGVISVDLSGKAKGRGVYLCPYGECFAKAIKKRAITRALEIELSEEETARLLEELKGYEKKDS